MKANKTSHHISQREASGKPGARSKRAKPTASERPKARVEMWALVTKSGSITVVSNDKECVNAEHDFWYPGARIVRVRVEEI